MTVLVAHPGKQHSYKLATALYEKQLLYKFVTTSYYKKSSATAFMAKLLRGNTKKKAMNRRCETIPDDYVLQFCEIHGLICTFCQGYLPDTPIAKRISQWMNNYINDCFGKKVARFAIKNKVDAVISFDNNSMVLFEYLKRYAPHIQCIMDTSIANRLYLKQIYEKDIQDFPNSQLFEQQQALWNNQYLSRLQRELNVADFFLVGSTFVQQSLQYSGISLRKIKKVPYGVNIDCFSQKKEYDIAMGLKLIYVGGINCRKGLHHLLPLIANLENEQVQLTVVGSIPTNSFLHTKYHNVSNIHFKGFLSHEELAKEYIASDAFILPSLGEGMAMVGLEAMSCGIPIICSSNTGLADIIESSGSGFVFSAGDDIALTQILHDVVEDKNILLEMGKKARTLATKYTWNTYSENVCRAITEMEKCE